MAAALLSAAATTPILAVDSTCHLLGADEVELARGSETAGDAVASLPGGRVRLGRNAVARDGTTVGGDTVWLGPGATVFDVATNELQPGRGAVVRGDVGPITLPPPDGTCMVPPSACGGAAVKVRQRGTERLPPGRYGEVVVDNGGMLVLAPGTYEVCGLRVGFRGAVVATGPAPVVLSVAGDVRIRVGGTLGRVGDGPAPIVNVAGAIVFASRKANVHALLAAPDAEVTIGPLAHLQGRACGRRVRLGHEARHACPGGPPPTSTTTTTSSTSTTATTTSSSTSSSTVSSTTSSSIATSSTSTSSTSTSTTTSSTSSSTSSITTSSTSSSVATSSTSTTTSTTIPPLCGNGALNPGESCDDGNNSDNDNCPANCFVASCTPLAGTVRQVTVSFAQPPGALVAGMTLLMNYPEEKVFMPPAGSGAIGAANFVPLYPPAQVFIRGFDLTHAVRGVVADDMAVPPGPIFELKFQDCTGAAAPLAGEFNCRVLDATDPSTNLVTGVTCSVTIP